MSSVMFVVLFDIIPGVRGADKLIVYEYFECWLEY